MKPIYPGMKARMSDGSTATVTDVLIDRREHAPRLLVLSANGYFGPDVRPQWVEYDRALAAGALVRGPDGRAWGSERAGRRAFLMELDSLYADVIVDRWQRSTGKRARHADTGAQFPKEPPPAPEALR